MKATANITPLAVLLLLVTFTTGIVDAVSILGLGRVFTALMTGNVVFAAFAIAGAEEWSAARSLAALAAFAVGALGAGRLARAMDGKSLRRWLGYAASLEVAAVASAAAIAWATGLGSEEPVWALYAVLALTALAMGSRNATALELKVPDLKTTVLTLTIASIAAQSRFAGGSSPRLGWRVLSILALFSGGAVGAALVRTFGVAPPLLVVAILIASGTAVFSQHSTSKQPRTS